MSPVAWLCWLMLIVCFDLLLTARTPLNYVTAGALVLTFTLQFVTAWERARTQRRRRA